MASCRWMRVMTRVCRLFFQGEERPGPGGFQGLALEVGA